MHDWFKKAYTTAGLWVQVILIVAAVCAGALLVAVLAAGGLIALIALIIYLCVKYRSSFTDMPKKFDGLFKDD